MMADNSRACISCCPRRGAGDSGRSSSQSFRLTASWIGHSPQLSRNAMATRTRRRTSPTSLPRNKQAWQSRRDCREPVRLGWLTFDVVDVHGRVPPARSHRALRGEPSGRLSRTRLEHRPVLRVRRARAGSRPRRCTPNAAYLMNSTTEAASRPPITRLNVRRARSERSARWTTAPKASQTKQHGSAASTKMSASVAACTSALPRL